jgi:hypothetical protein
MWMGGWIHLRSKCKPKKKKNVETKWKRGNRNQKKPEGNKIKGLQGHGWKNS